MRLEIPATSTFKGEKGDIGPTGRGFNPRGDWVSGTTYAVDDLAVYGGTTYRRRTAGAGTTIPPNAAGQWEVFAERGISGRGFTPRGEWASTETYAVDDLVTYLGQTYRCKTTTGSGTPAVNTNKWELWAAKGQEDTALRTDLADPAKGAVAVGWKPATGKSRTVQQALESLPTVEDYGAKGKVFTGITASRDSGMASNVIAPSGRGVDSTSKINYVEVGDYICIEAATTVTVTTKDANGNTITVPNVPRNVVTKVTAITGTGSSLRFTLEDNCGVFTNQKVHPSDDAAMQECMDREPHFRLSKIPTGSEGWNVCGEWYLPGAGSRAPRPTTIECGGYPTRIKRRGVLNQYETRQIIDGQNASGTPGPSNITIKNLFLDGNAEDLHFTSSDLADITGISIIIRDTNPIYHSYNVNLLDCEFKSIPGPVTFFANVHGGIHRCRAFGKLEKGGYQFVNATTDFQVQNPVVEGSSDDCIGINAYHDLTVATASGSAGGGQPRNIVITGGYLEISKAHVGGRCLSVLGGRDVTAVGVRCKGSGLPQINISDSPGSQSYYQPENIDITWYGEDSRLPHWNNINSANVYNPGSPGLSIECNGGRNLRFDGTIMRPGGHGVYIRHLGGQDLDVNLSVRVADAGKPLSSYTIGNAEVEGYTNGEVRTNYKGHPSAVNTNGGASYIDAQCGMFVESQSSGSGEVTLRLVRCRFETPRLQNVYIAPSVRLKGLFVDGLRVRNGYVLGEEVLAASGTLRMDVDQIYIGSPAQYPKELALNGIRARDTRTTKLCRNHLRLGRAVAGYADMGSDNLFPAGETIAGQRGFDVENNAQTNLRSAREQTIVFNAGVTDTAAANANGATAVFAPNDPVFRRKINGRSYFKVRVQYSFGGSVASATRFRMQYMASADLNSTGAWTTLVQSTGSHVVGTIYESADVMIPVDALVDSLLLRPVIYGGDGVASPSIRTCVAVFS